MKIQLVAVAALFGIASLAGAAIFNVDSTLDEVDADSEDGACVSTPSGVCTLRAAIMQANIDAAEDTINLPAGVYSLSIAGADEDAAASGDLDIRASLWVNGAGTDATIIDAAGIDRVVEVMLGDSVAFQDLTIRNGAAVTAGRYLGGGVYHRGYNLWLTRVRLTGNSANAGGGLMVGSGATAVLQGCTLDHNATIDLGFTNAWGAAALNHGRLDLSSSTVTANSNAFGTVEAVHFNNCGSASSTIAASTIAGNNAGGVYAYNCDLSIYNATIVDNAGNGLYFGQWEVTSGYTLTSANNIIAGNTVADCSFYNTTPTQSHNLDSDDSCGLSLAAGDLPATDPLLLPLRDWGGDTHSMYPKPGASPVIDAGAGGSACTAFDQRLVPRPVDGDGDLIAVCDMGSVEAGDLVFFDDFEGGTTGEWSSAAGF